MATTTTEIVLPPGMAEAGFRLVESESIEAAKRCLVCVPLAQYVFIWPNSDIGWGLVDGFAVIHSWWNIEPGKNIEGLRVGEKVGETPCQQGGDHEYWTWRFDPSPDKD